MYLHLSKFLITGFVYIWNEDAPSTAACKPLIWFNTYALSKIYIGNICFLWTKLLTVKYVKYSRIGLLDDEDNMFLRKSIVSHTEFLDIKCVDFHDKWSKLMLKWDNQMFRIAVLYGNLASAWITFVNLIYRRGWPRQMITYFLCYW